MPAITGITRRTPHSPRWDFFRKYQVEVDDELFISRWRVQCPWFAVLASRIYHPDNDRDPHNHSRSFITICLTGNYLEYIFDPGNPAAGPVRIRHHRRLHPYYVSHRHAHKIVALNGTVRTLVLAGRHHGTFWFCTPGGPVDWKDYK